jgi:hypothetical protein
MRAAMLRPGGRFPANSGSREMAWSTCTGDSLPTGMANPGRA